MLLVTQLFNFTTLMYTVQELVSPLHPVIQILEKCMATCKNISVT
jgi:hypothetical protein